jgi:hypothetical protein
VAVRLEFPRLIEAVSGHVFERHVFQFFQSNEPRALTLPYCAEYVVENILDFQPNSTYFVSRGENRSVSELQVQLTRRKAASFTLRLRLCDLCTQAACWIIAYALWWRGRAFPVVAVILNCFRGVR